MNILTFTTLYPNARQPQHGIFVEQRLRHLLAETAVAARVVAPVPWFPFSHRWFGRYGQLAGVERQEERHGIAVFHPRYFHLPWVGMYFAPLFLALAAAPALRRLRREGFDFQLIDAHYFYPDGVAAVLLGWWFRRPVVVTARGSDLTLLPRYRLPRRLIQWAARRADGLVTVCQALREPLVELGMAAERVTVLRNGVDLTLFQPWPVAECRATLGLDGPGPLLLTVGHLIPRKGHDLVLGVLARLPGARLVVVGEGPQEGALRRLAVRLGVAERVHWAGRVAQEALPRYYSAADLLVLASSREGWANVLLESMACGTPVAATAVWGTPEVVTTPAAGALAAERSVEALLAACRAVLDRPPGRAATRRHAEGFSWVATSRGQWQLWQRLLGREGSG